MISEHILAALGARLVDPDAPRVKCQRWACELTARDCGARYVAGQDKFASTTMLLCRSCTQGERNAALASQPRRRDAKSAQRDQIAAPVPPREILPFQMRQGD